MAGNGKSKRVTKPYIHLAAAILSSGVKCNDIAFLESEWGKYLKGEVGDYLNSPDKVSVSMVNIAQVRAKSDK